MDVPILENMHFPIPESVDVQTLKHNFKELILILWIMTPEHANKYENIMLINVMKFDELTLKKVRTNLPKKNFPLIFGPPSLKSYVRPCMYQLRMNELPSRIGRLELMLEE